jgi:hypothetical protein
MDKLYLLLCFYLPDKSYDWADPNLQKLVDMGYLRRQEDSFSLTTEGYQLMDVLKHHLPEDLM